ncbi:MAG TPA: peptide-methionine (S)-S-oxide reductase MsrA [Burkholderiaceae bacterium]|nr:peptide-methionine (S)-S-oxide reductase MsrA [Burkholderiaceae bacterium]
MVRWVACLLALAVPATWSQPTPPAETAIFAGGCFWSVESDFDRIDGVISTTAGYVGGRKENPTYREVSAGWTGHVEAVRVEFDPARISYGQLLERFWPTIDPTVKGQQFCDVGSQYRTGIYPLNEKQMKAALASRTALEQAKPFPQPIVTEVLMAGPFYPAEEYHQNYYLKNPVGYAIYRRNCGRDARLKQLWGEKAARH